MSGREPATEHRGTIQRPPPDPDESARPRCGALVLEVELGGAGDQKGLREGEGSLVSIHIWRDGRKSWLGNARLSGRAPRVVVEDEHSALRDEVAALRNDIARLR